MDFSVSVAGLVRTIGLALGENPVDVLLKNARLVNVLSGEIHDADIAVADGLIVGFGDYQARRIIDCEGRHVCPGLIDGHIHIESTLLTPWEFARAAAAHGTCAVVWDPHEIANVLGRAGIESMLRLTEGCPLSFQLMVSSCVPATEMETSGARITAEDVAFLMREYRGRVLGLAELMNYPGVLAKDPDVLAKIAACDCAVIDGHAPLVSGKALNAYIMAGPSSDHECTTSAEATEKLRKGMHLFMREGSDEKNLRNLIASVNGFNAQNISLVCDDRDPEELTTNGHMDHNVRLAVSLGMAPIRAIQMASINTARHFRMKGRGAVAPGYRADLVILDDLECFRVRQVLLAGRDVAEIAFRPTGPSGLAEATNTVRLSAPEGRLTPDRFQIVQVKDELEIVQVKDEVRCIGIIPRQIITKSLVVRPKIENGLALADPGRDLAKLAVVERHGKNGNIGLAFVQGLGLARGAVAGTVAHDAHNLVIAGAHDEDMALAGNTLAQVGGGYCVVADGRVLALLELPLAGLMSLNPLEQVVAEHVLLREVFKEVAIDPDVNTHPFMTLSFLSLAVIPELKLTDRGLVDVDRFEMVNLWA
jgi:adenine deaminase